MISINFLYVLSIKTTQVRKSEKSNIFSDFSDLPLLSPKGAGRQRGAEVGRGGSGGQAGVLG